MRFLPKHDLLACFEIPQRKNAEPSPFSLSLRKPTLSFSFPTAPFFFFSAAFSHNTGHRKAFGQHPLLRNLPSFPTAVPQGGRKG